MATKTELERDLAELKLKHNEAEQELDALRAVSGELDAANKKLDTAETDAKNDKAVVAEYRAFAITVFNLCGGPDDDGGIPWGTDIIQKAHIRLGMLLRGDKKS